MGSSPEPATSASPKGPDPSIGSVANDDFDCTSLSDLELILERDRLREQLEELTVNPARSPAVCQLLANIDQQIDRMTDELTGRALSRHPTSPGPNSRRHYRSLVR